MYIHIYVQYPLFSSDFNETGIFRTHLRIILKYQISLNSVQWETSCKYADGRTDRQTDGQTDMTKRTVTFLKFAKAPNKTTLFQN